MVVVQVGVVGYRVDPDKHGEESVSRRYPSVHLKHNKTPSVRQGKNESQPQSTS